MKEVDIQMDMNVLQRMVQEQKLILTNEMQQSLRILQMTAYDLEQDIHREIEENPLLEIDNSKISENYEDVYEKYYQDISHSKNYDYESKSYDNDYVDPINFVATPKSLRDFLREQVLDSKEDVSIDGICYYIIESIDDRGYLGESVEAISKYLNTSIEKVEHALQIVQGFQPSGIAARNLEECLTIQLKNNGIENKYIYQIAENYLQQIAENRLKDIGKELAIDVKDVQEYCNIIKGLEPKPSRGFFTGDTANYVVPEAYIRRIGEEFHIIMNDKSIPKLTINTIYREALNGDKKDSMLNDYVKGKINGAMYLIKGIESRRNTIYKILEKIVELQKNYFLMGNKYLKPMTIANIAESLNMHESTISRAIRDKYINTDYGTVKLKNLFTNAISSQSEEGMSSNTVKLQIKKLIDNEDRRKPLSDQDISEELDKLKIKISRRTVAKYREELGIGASSKRKVF